MTSHPEATRLFEPSGRRRLPAEHETAVTRHGASLTNRAAPGDNLGRHPFGPRTAILRPTEWAVCPTVGVECFRQVTGRVLSWTRTADSSHSFVISTSPLVPRIAPRDPPRS